MGLSMLAKLWSRAYTLDVRLRWTVFLGHVFILLIKSFSMLLSLFGGILDNISLPSAVFVLMAVKFLTRKSVLDNQPFIERGSGREKAGSTMPNGYGVSRPLSCSWWWWWVCNFFSCQHFLFPITIPASLVSQTVKNLPAMQETQVASLGQENPLEKG